MIAQAPKPGSDTFRGVIEEIVFGHDQRKRHTRQATANEPRHLADLTA